MIPKISSEELNNILIDAKNKLDVLDKRFDTTKSDMEDKLKVINYESEYVQSTLAKLKSGAYEKVNGMIGFAYQDKLLSGYYDRYGSTIHAELIKSPINVFNLEVSAFNEFYFREDVSVSVNGIEDDKYLSLLKHDAISKPIFFDTYKTNLVKVKIELTDLATILGPTKFNVIEIDPFLHGSFDIEEIRIYEFTEAGTVDSNQKPTILSKIPGVGIERIVLPQKLNFYKVEIDFRIKYETYRNTSLVYPFGLKHIYFYNMDFKTDSYLIAEITSDKNISYIKDEITIKTPFGDETCKISTSDIELYLDRDGESLELYSSIEPSYADEINEIARNVKKIYARIPIKPGESLIGIAFNIVNRSS